MSPAIGKSCNKICNVVRIRQMLKKWRLKARVTAGRAAPHDVPAGHVAVCVGLGPRCTRFVVRATYLNLPIFKRLLVRAEEEFGFENHGPLTIPCDESVFEEILRVVASGPDPDPAWSLEDFQRCCHVGMRASLDALGESRPLLHGLADESVC